MFTLSIAGPTVQLLIISLPAAVVQYLHQFSCISAKWVSKSNNVSAEDVHSYSADRDYIYHSNG